VPLGQIHVREAFTCGKPRLDAFLKQQARQEQDRGVSVCWILPDPEDSRRICGYYTLSMYAIKVGDLPEDLKKRLPKYPEMPAALLGRLAVDSNYRGQGLGEHLLLDAIQKVLNASKNLGTLALVVDAKDEEAASFYAHFGFIAFPSQPLRLFLPTATFEQILPKGS
jgi:GNAT superfamily N-acetyltransferase